MHDCIVEVHPKLVRQWCCFDCKRAGVETYGSVQQVGRDGGAQGVGLELYTHPRNTQARRRIAHLHFSVAASPARPQIAFALERLVSSSFSLLQSQPQLIALAPRGPAPLHIAGQRFGSVCARAVACQLCILRTHTPPALPSTDPVQLTPNFRLVYIGFECAPGVNATQETCTARFGASLVHICADTTERPLTMPSILLGRASCVRCGVALRSSSDRRRIASAEDSSKAKLAGETSWIRE